MGITKRKTETGGYNIVNGNNADERLWNINEKKELSVLYKKIKYLYDHKKIKDNLA